MILNDIVADTLARLKNGQAARRLKIKVFNTNLNKEILKVLYLEGYIRGYNTLNKQHLEVLLKYHSDRPAIKIIEKISKNSKRVYLKTYSLPKAYSGLGILILSTPNGVMSDKEAKKQNLGGELICRIF
jgi:small subunit ribosomal protein S8